MKTVKIQPRNFRSNLFIFSMVAMIIGPILVRAGNQMLDDQFQRTLITQTPTANTFEQVQCLPEVDSETFSNIERWTVTQKDDPSVNVSMEEHFLADQDALELPASGDQQNLVEEGIKRRDDVLKYLRDGDIHSARNLVYAAFIFQHGNCPDHYLLANKLAQKALEAGDEEARWIFAASFDRYLMSLGKPQKYGTQYIWTRDGFGLYPVDPDTTDKERAEYNVPSLQQALNQQTIGDGNTNVKKRRLETWWLTLIGIGYPFLSAVVALLDNQNRHKRGWLLLCTGVFIFLLSWVGHYFQLRGLNQLETENQSWIWIGINSLMFILWFAFAFHETSRIIKRLPKT